MNACATLIDILRRMKMRLVLEASNKNTNFRFSEGNTNYF